MLYSTCKGYNTDSVTRSTYFEYINFSTTYHRSSHFKDFHFKENTERYSSTGKYTENSSGEKSRWVNARLQLLQGASKWVIFRLSYLLRQFLWAKREKKYDRQRRKIQEGKNKQRQYTGKTFIFRKKELHHKSLPYRTACFGRFTTLSSLAAGQLVVSQTPRERRLVKWWRCCCRPFRLLVELAAKYTPPLIVSKYTPAPGL